MKVGELYELMCRLYRPHHVVEIENYLINDILDNPDEIPGNRICKREALILRQNGEDLEIGLHISPSAMAALECSDPASKLDELALVIEGLSHFIYIIDRAAKERPVSRLELELQAEVDKFIFLHLLAKHYLPGIFDALFCNFHYNKNLSNEEIERYATASHFAAKYCAHLRERCFNPLRIAALAALARDFFERNLPSKLERLIP